MNDYLLKRVVDLHMYLYKIQMLVLLVIVNMDQEMYCLLYFEKNSDVDECI